MCIVTVCGCDVCCFSFSFSSISYRTHPFYSGISFCMLHVIDTCTSCMHRYMLTQTVHAPHKHTHTGTHMVCVCKTLLNALDIHPCVARQDLYTCFQNSVKLQNVNPVTNKNVDDFIIDISPMQSWQTIAVQVHGRVGSKVGKWLYVIEFVAWNRCVVNLYILIH